MKIQDNDFFKELIDNATCNQDIHTNFISLLEDAIEESMENNPDEFRENLTEFILVQLGVGL